VTVPPGLLVSMVEIARRAGVQRPAVSNWRRRHTGFPRPSPGSDPEVFDAADIASWLDRRKIPKNALAPEESPGATFGDRFRGSFGHATESDGHAVEVARPQVDEEERVRLALADITTRLIRIMDRLRGLVDPQAFGDLVLTMLYLRTREPDHWTRFVDHARSPGTMATLLDEIIRELHPEWPGLLLLSRDAQAEPAKEPSLREIVEVLDRALELPATSAARRPIDLGPHLFRHLLPRFAAAEGRRGGEFHTPGSVAELMVRLVAPSPGESVCDPCCGTGELLVTATARDEGSRRAVVRGEALGTRACRLATMHLAMNQVPAKVGASAVTGLSRGLAGSERYDVVVTNPPFNLPQAGPLDPDDPRWRYGVPPAHNANFAWLQHVASMLDEGGRAAVVMPDNAASSLRSAERAIRAGMVEDGLVECVVALPTGLFVTAPGVRASIWLLRRGSPAEEGVLFINAGDLGEEARRAQRGLWPDDIVRIAQTYHDWRDQRAGGTFTDRPGFARHSALPELRDAEYDLNARVHAGTAPEPFDKEELMRDVRDLMAGLADLRDRAAQVDDRLARSWGGALPWRA
jgi:type I restriction enzyme M protein